ncbi:MAG: DedA family protein [Gaiellaceae bacterium]
MTHFVEQYGLWVVFGVVFLEVAGLPFIPGETALIAAAAVASQGHGSIAWTIALAVAAAVLGSLTGYALGRRWGRGLLARWTWLERVATPGVERSDAFFAKHGSKAVFLGRFVPVLRATLGWMAGVGRMPLPRFLFWCVVGAIAWGCAIGLGAYYAGAAIINTIQRDAGIGIGIVAALVVVVGGLHVARRRREGTG